MNRKLFVLLASLALPLGGAGDAALERATMRGLKAISVAIDPVAPEVEKEGVTADLLRTRLEERLQAAGIKVDPASIEFLGLRLISVRAARGPLAIAASIGVYQPLTLNRDRTVKTVAQTWEVNTVLLADPKMVYRACMDSVDELADRFVAAYRAVNPAAAGAPPERDK
jgi:hypothetical protein